MKRLVRMRCARCKSRAGAIDRDDGGRLVLTIRPRYGSVVDGSAYGRDIPADGVWRCQHGCGYLALWEAELNQHVAEAEHTGKAVTWWMTPTEHPPPS